MPAGACWREDVRYVFSAQQIDLIESVADELHGMVRGAVRYAVENRLLAPFGIRPEAARLVEAAWADHWRGGALNERAGGLVGRLTLAYDGRDSIRLLACNYDVPDGLFAASIIQRNWLEAMCPEADQFNGLHEAIVERWEELAGSGPHRRERLHLTCLTPDPAREGELAYAAATAIEAGLDAALLPIQGIGWDGSRFRDQEGNAISWLFKLYPWEAMARDDFAQKLRVGAMAVVEPIWRWLMSNHGLLALLSHLHPGHPHLCRASMDEADIAGADAVTARSFFGLDGASTRMAVHGRLIVDTGPPAGDPGGTLWMETPPLFEQDAVHAVLDAWIVGDKCLGMTVRESADPHIGLDAAVVPHIFRP